MVTFSSHRCDVKLINNDIVFVGVIRRKQVPLQSTDVSDTVSMDSFDKELFTQLATLKGSPPSEFGYGYGGKVFVTQNSFWFYSFTMLSCINTVCYS